MYAKKIIFVIGIKLLKIEAEYKILSHSIY